MAPICCRTMIVIDIKFMSAPTGKLVLGIFNFAFLATTVRKVRGFWKILIVTHIALSHLLRCKLFKYLHRLSLCICVLTFYIWSIWIGCNWMATLFQPENCLYLEASSISLSSSFLCGPLWWGLPRDSYNMSPNCIPLHDNALVWRKDRFIAMHCIASIDTESSVVP